MPNPASANGTPKNVLRFMNPPWMAADLPTPQTGPAAFYDQRSLGAMSATGPRILHTTGRRRHRRSVHPQRTQVRGGKTPCKAMQKFSVR